MDGKRTALGTIAFFLLCNLAAPDRAREVSSQEVALRPEREALSVTTELSGWKRFNGGNVELWLPESYAGGDLENDLDVAIANLRRLGPEFAQTVQTVEQNRDAYSLLAIDTQVGPSGTLTSAIVARERVVSTLTLDAYLDAAASRFPPPFQVIGRDVVSLPRYRAGRLILETPLNATVTAKQVVYTIKAGNTVWTIAYSTSLDEFERRLPTFEKSIETFAIGAAAESISRRQ